MYTGTFKPANSTTARKPGNDMKKNASIAKMGDSPAAWQKADKGLGFNGQDNTAQRASNNGRYAGNQHSGGFKNPDMIQERQMPNRKGNYAEQADRTRVPPCMTGNPMTGFKNPDSINLGSGPTNPGSTRPWMPSAGQNYKGNPSMIQERQLYNNKGNKD